MTPSPKIRDHLDALPAAIRHRVRHDIASGTPLVARHAVMLHHITMNLIDTAAKYSQPDTAIGVRVVEAATGGAMISVVDGGQGVGVDGGDLFGLFRRGRNADSAPGSGVGRAVVDAFARALGHEVSVSNRSDGNGPVFAVGLRGISHP